MTTGDDDANEGAAPGECPQHLWTLNGLTATASGVHLDYECAHCGEVALTTPQQLAGDV